MNAEQERRELLRERAESWREEKLIDSDGQQRIDSELQSGWRTHGLVVQVVFFVLTCIGVAASYGFLKLLRIGGTGIVIGVACLAVAELLIRQRKWFATGVESALWLAGLISFITELPSSGEPEALLVIAAACAIAGARVRNALFGAAAAILIVAYFETKWDLGVIAALVIACAAVVALTRTWRRPSTEWLWIALAVLLPPAGWFAADPEWRTATIALYAIFGLVALSLAIARLHHALFFAGAIGLAITVVEASQLITISIEAKLAIAGSLLLAFSFAISRALRNHIRGLVVTPAKLTHADDALEIAGALAAAHTTAAQQEPTQTRPQGDGKFGGAGATGDF